jgi:hypothetical protein
MEQYSYIQVQRGQAVTAQFIIIIEHLLANLLIIAVIRELLAAKAIIKRGPEAQTARPQFKTWKTCGETCGVRFVESS